MKLIPLTQGKFTIVDDEDYDYLMQWKWCTNTNNNTFYAVRMYKDIHYSMHRVIMKVINQLEYIDHLDFNGLNNQKSNLRKVTCSENMQNMRIRGLIKYRGVSLAKSNRCQVRVKHKYKSYYVGVFPNTACGHLLAALAYDTKALELFGNNVVLNFK